MGPSISRLQGCHPRSLCTYIYSSASAASEGWLFLLLRSEPLVTQSLSPAPRPLAVIAEESRDKRVAFWL